MSLKTKQDVLAERLAEMGVGTTTPITHRLNNILTEQEMQIFGKAYRETFDEERLASGFNEPVSIRFMSLEDIQEFDKNEIEINVCVGVDFLKGYEVTSTLTLYLSDLNPGNKEIGKEEITQIVEDNFENIYCDEAVASTTDKQKQKLASGTTLDKWILYLTEAHKTDELGRCMIANFKDKNSYYGDTFLKDFKKQLSKLLIDTLVDFKS